MAFSNNKKCGPHAFDHYNDYDRYDKRSHLIDGTGPINSCNAYNSTSWSDDYTIESGITELYDGCFSISSVSSVSLPTTLVTIGSNCFKNSKIANIKLPEGLKKIGHNNFPATLTSLTIPKSIKEFFVDNVAGCRDLKEISVDESNKYYKAKDGILYNYDMTEILFCPNAKTGKVIIPNTVTRIGDYCFAQCKSLDMIVIPISIKDIGNYAFQGVQIKKLNIRNSVRSIGDFCFMGAVISEEFKFSNQVATIPNQAFNSFECHTPLTFIDRLKVIGFAAFYKCKGSTLPQSISLYEAREIYNLAFQSSCVTHIELFSSIDVLGVKIFDNCTDNLVVRCFTYAPLTSKEDAFGNLGENATLVVPIGTKIIFENLAPWSTFPNIEEWEIDEDKNDEGKFVKVSDEIYCKRLQSIAESKRKVDRLILKEITKVSQVMAHLHNLT